MIRIMVLSILCGSSLMAQVASFSFQVNGNAPDSLKETLEAAGKQWANYLHITVPVKVNAFLVNAPGAAAYAITLANGRSNFPNAKFTDVLYPTALANQLANQELNPGEFDMDIYFNLAYWYHFGTSQPLPGEYDFFALAMHEMGHGLGFYSSSFVDGNGIGSFGNIALSRIYPLSPSFPWHGQDSMPSIYDKFLVKKSGQQLTALPNNSKTLGDSLLYGNAYFDGSRYAIYSSSNFSVQVTGGFGSFNLGDDILHLDESYSNCTMSDPNRVPCNEEGNVLKEIGWVTKLVGLETNNENPISLFPNPASDHCIINSSQPFEKIQLYSNAGLLVYPLSPTPTSTYDLRLEGLSPGIYFLELNGNGYSTTVRRKLMVLAP